MVIDFHTHMFPDKIADKTITFLAEVFRTTTADRWNMHGTFRVCEKGWCRLKYCTSGYDKAFSV